MIFGCLQLKFEKKIDFERQFLKKSVLAGILLGFCWDAGISLGFLLGSCWYSYPSIPAPTEPLSATATEQFSKVRRKIVKNVEFC